ncbi:hypothetical protein ACSSS7_006749 [Eimeria intestinalis]
MAKGTNIFPQLEALLTAIDGVDAYMAGSATAAAAVAANLQGGNDAMLKAVSTETAHKSKHLARLGHDAALMANREAVPLSEKVWRPRQPMFCHCALGSAPPVPFELPEDSPTAATELRCIIRAPASSL